MKIRSTLIWLMTLLVSHASSFAQSHTQYYVSPSGSDVTGTGTFSNPWKTISFAVNAAGYDFSTVPATLVDSNVTIYLRAGTYAQTNAIYIGPNRGPNGKWFTIKPYNNEFVAVEGVNLNQKFACIFVIDSARYVRIEGLDIRNLTNDPALTSGGVKDVRYGIAIIGSTRHIQIVNNDLYDMKWTRDTTKAKNPAPDDVMSAITVLGSSNNSSRHIEIIDNTIHDIVPGYAEAVAINGNVDTFEVRGNEIYDIANIGIVSAGNYQWVLNNYPNLLPANNQSRNGRITNNEVYRCLSPVAISAGIYLDGSKNIQVDSNDSYHNGVGISVGNEQNNSSSNGHLVYDNVLYENLGAGIFIGSNNATSIVENSTLKWNTISHNYYINPALYSRTQGHYGTLDSAGMWAEVVIRRARNITFEENEITSGSDILTAYLIKQTNLTFRYNEYFTLHNDPCNAWFVRDTDSNDVGDVFYNTFHQYVKNMGLDATSHCNGVAYNSNGCGTTLLARQAVTQEPIIQRIAVYPNPVDNNLIVTIQQLKAGMVNVRLWDITGKLVLSQQKQLPAGVQVLGWNDLRSYHVTPGLYLLQVQAGGKKETLKVMIR